MGLFGALTKFTQAVVNVAAIPIDMSVDAFTMGDDHGSRTVKRVKKVVDKLEESYDSIGG